MKIELITNPREHRAAWIKANPQALVENGGLLCAEDLARFACDACMADLNADGPHKCVDGMTLCNPCYSCITFSR